MNDNDKTRLIKTYPSEDRTRLAGTAEAGSEGPTTPLSGGDEKTQLIGAKSVEADDRTRLAAQPQPVADQTNLTSQATPNLDATRLADSQTDTELAEISWQTQVASTLQSGESAMASGSLGPGSIIRDRFVLESSLGAGGMGSVFRALDIRKQEAQDAEPHVAIKVLSGEIATHPQAFIMLQRETRKSQQLAHPNIITVYDFDRDGDRVYMTMEELRGKTLDTMIAENPRGMPLETVHAIVDGISQGLSYAHSKDIIHSDLKPGNIFMTDEGVIKLLDFGIARAVSDSSTPGSGTVFDAGELGGLTPTYASLEMFAGEDPSPSDDVYALGLIAYELATGIHPYRRLPAPRALEEQRQAERPKNLSNRQWRAVSGAISLTTDNRITSVDDFRKLYFGRPTLLILSGVATLLVAATAAATLLLAPPEKLEAVPFDTLPAEIQVKVETNLEQAREALQFRDINAALHHLSVVDELHQYNPTAKVLAEDLVQMTLERIEPLEDDIEYKRIQTLLSYAVLANNEALAERLEQLGAP